MSRHKRMFMLTAIEDSTEPGTINWHVRRTLWTFGHQTVSTILGEGHIHLDVDQANTRWIAEAFLLAAYAEYRVQIEALTPEDHP